MSKLKTLLGVVAVLFPCLIVGCTTTYVDRGFEVVKGKAFNHDFAKSLKVKGLSPKALIKELGKPFSTSRINKQNFKYHYWFIECRKNSTISTSSSSTSKQCIERIYEVEFQNGIGNHGQYKSLITEEDIVE